MGSVRRSVGRFGLLNGRTGPFVRFGRSLGPRYSTYVVVYSIARLLHGVARGIWLARTESLLTVSPQLCLRGEEEKKWHRRIFKTVWVATRRCQCWLSSNLLRNAKKTFFNHFFKTPRKIPNKAKSWHKFGRFCQQIYAYFFFLFNASELRHVHLCNLGLTLHAVLLLLFSPRSECRLPLPTEIPIGPGCFSFCSNTQTHN